MCIQIFVSINSTTCAWRYYFVYFVVFVDTSSSFVGSKIYFIKRLSLFVRLYPSIREETRNYLARYIAENGLFLFVSHLYTIIIIIIIIITIVIITIIRIIGNDIVMGSVRSVRPCIYPTHAAAIGLMSKNYSQVLRTAARHDENCVGGDKG